MDREGEARKMNETTPFIGFSLPSSLPPFSLSSYH